MFFVLPRSVFFYCIWKMTPIRTNRWPDRPDVFLTLDMDGRPIGIHPSGDIVPRCSNESAFTESASHADISMETLKSMYHLPCVVVAKELGISVTNLKNLCRSRNISRWPHRQIESIRKIFEMRCATSFSSDKEEDDLIGKLNGLLDAIYAKPEFTLPKEVKLMRQELFKKTYLQRGGGRLRGPAKGTA